jgi:sugar/nucleoside kinase (ribokinase family)
MTTILGLGAACIDISLAVDEKFIQTIPGSKGGSIPISFNDLHFLIEKSQQIPRISMGGSCANTLKGLTHLGEQCQLLSCVGTDAWGQQFEKEMQQQQIQTFFTYSALPTTTVLCLITPDGQRTMRFYAGSSLEMSESLFNQINYPLVKHLHLDAYSCQHENLVKNLIKKAHQAHLTISIDLSSFEIVHTFHTFLMTILPLVTIVFANRDEIQAFTSLSLEEGCLALQKICPLVVILMDKQGCLIGNQGQLIAVRTRVAQVLDTTGAGDNFASGFLYGWLHQRPLIECGQLGNFLGAAIVEVEGTTLPISKWNQIKQLFN